MSYDETPKLKALHSCYAALTGGIRPWDMEKLGHWRHWAAKFTEDDLRLVVAHIKSRIAEGQGFQAQLSFRNIVLDHMKFEDRLVEARSDQRAKNALKRRPVVNKPRESVLRATGRTSEKQTPERPANDIVPKTKEEMAVFFAKCRKDANLEERA